MKKVIKLFGFFALLFWTSTSFALKLTPYNHATDTTENGVRTIYFPTRGVTGSACEYKTDPLTGEIIKGHTWPLNTFFMLDAGSVLSSDPISPEKSYAAMIFTISNTKGLATINGGTFPSTASEISIRVEENSTANLIALVDFRGDGGYSGVDSYQVSFGRADNTIVDGDTRIFGIAFKDPSTGPGNAISKSGTGFCTRYHTYGAGSGTCRLSPGEAAVQGTLKIGLVRTGSTLSDTNADVETIKIVTASCPPRAGGTVLTPPTPNFTVEAGDSEIKFTNSTSTPADVIPLKSMVIFMHTQTPVKTNAGLTRELLGHTGTGSVTIDRLINDQQYCFQIGWVNKAGLLSTGSGWTNTFDDFSPAESKCVTPSVVEGFLKRNTCFIASAAYGKDWDPRLEILKQFRNQVLRRSSLGRAFEQWYYSWSPSAARWILRHPSFQAPVRVLLFPFVEFARVTLWIQTHLSRNSS